jgi:luciferase family oxidoreductase group 1
VAESFRVLHALYPGRIDLGIGRATAPPLIDQALRAVESAETDLAARPLAAPDPRPAAGAWLAHGDQVEEIVAWLDRAFPAGHPFASVALLPGVGGGPEPWLLGSSLTSALLAGRLGLRYCYAAFVDPASAPSALQTYRACFQPSPLPSCVDRAHSMLAVHACCGESDREGDRLRASVELFYARPPDPAGNRRPLADPDAAVAELGGVPERSRCEAGSWPRHLSGGPDRVRALIERMSTEAGADEVMIQDLIARPADRARSYELIAGAFGLEPLAPPLDSRYSP